MSETIIGQDNTKLLEGRQLVTTGQVQVGDIIILPDGLHHDTDMSPHMISQYSGRTVESLTAASHRVYRKMPTAQNLDRDNRCVTGPCEPPFSHPSQCGTGVVEAPSQQLLNVCAEAVRLVLGDRNESYGSPADDYTKTAKVWSGLLAHKLKPGVEITPKEAVLMMAGMKLSREMHKHKRDNLIDCAGYVLCAEWIQDGKKPFVQ
jgi:hypothetical protein